MSSDETAAAPALDTPLPLGVPEAVAVPLPWWARIYHGFSFFLSAILSPYIVIPVGTVGIVYLRSHSLFWTALSVFTSTLVPVFFVIFQVLRGKITDVHVMEREQRGGPFMIAIVSSLAGAGILYLLGAPPSVWGLSLVLAINGIVLYGITAIYKISMHVSVLSATVLTAIIVHPKLEPWTLLWMIPLLMWARHARKRHTIWQGIAGCLVATVITATTMQFLIPEFVGLAWLRLTRMGGLN